jgi:hypothetical protein
LSSLAEEPRRPSWHRAGPALLLLLLLAVELLLLLLLPMLFPIVRQELQ